MYVKTILEICRRGSFTILQRFHIKLLSKMLKLTDKNEKICKGAVPDIFSCWSTLDMTNNKSITI